MTSIEENKALVRRFVELENKGDLEALFSLFSSEYVSHYNIGDSTMEENKKFWPTLRMSFPDIRFSLEHIVAEDDKVAYREIMMGTHLGEFKGIPPTGKQIKMINTCIIRIEKRKFAEGWCTLDEWNLMQQIGGNHAQ